MNKCYQSRYIVLNNYLMSLIDDYWIKNFEEPDMENICTRRKLQQFLSDMKNLEIKSDDRFYFKDEVDLDSIIKYKLSKRKYFVTVSYNELMDVIKEKADVLSVSVNEYIRLILLKYVFGNEPENYKYSVSVDEYTRLWNLKSCQTVVCQPYVPKYMYEYFKNKYKDFLTTEAMNSAFFYEYIVKPKLDYGRVQKEFQEYKKDKLHLKLIYCKNNPYFQLANKDELINKVYGTLLYYKDLKENKNV